MAGEWEEVGAAMAAPAADAGWEEVGAAPTEASKEPTASGASRGIGNVAGLADMALSLPGQMVGLGAEMGSRAVSAVGQAAGSGETRREAAQSAQATGQKVADTLGNPLQKLMKVMGFGEGYEQSDVAGAMDTFGKWVGKGGDWVEKQTKGALLKEDVESLVNEAMLVGGPQLAHKGVKTAWDHITTPKEGASTPHNYEMFKDLVKEDNAVKPDLATPLEFEKVKVEPTLQETQPQQSGMDYSQHKAEQMAKPLEQRVQAERQGQVDQRFDTKEAQQDRAWQEQKAEAAKVNRLEQLENEFGDMQDVLEQQRGAGRGETKKGFKQRGKQRGEIDPKLLTGMGLAAGGAMTGAYLGGDTKSALLGGVAGAALMLPLKGKFADISPKAAYVKSMVEKFGPEFSKAAAHHWEKTNERVSATPKVEGTDITQRAKSLEDGQYTLAQQKTADQIRAKQFVKQLSPEEFALASSEEFYNARPEEGMRGDRPLAPEFKAVKERVLDPLIKHTEDLYEEAVKLGGLKELADLDPHNIRSTKKSWLQKVSRFGQDAFPSSGFAKRAGTMKDRSMFGLQMPDGSLRVVSQDGLKLNGFGPDRKPIGAIARSEKQLRPGDTVKVQGGEAKLVQVPTRMIESQTGIEYNKNVLANYLSAQAELKSYIREKKWLGEVTKGLQQDGLAIPADNVSSAPKGYTRLQGESTLEKYYVQDRIAAAFEDGILKSSSPTNLLERINTAAIGTMFWNPAPHLYNAFDHWVNSMGWDLVNPMQYKSIAQSTYAAFKDVSKLTPEYLKMLDNGFGLQYGRVAAEGVLEGVIKGIPKNSWGALAKEWGYGTRPDKMIADLYKGSKHVLWGGSDVMMISAYKHLASKQGVEVFNKALGKYVEAHNPNYRIPANIGFDQISKIPGMNEAMAGAVSRGMSKVMQSRTFNIFGRYHYGQMKSLGTNVRDLISQNASSTQSRAQSLGHLAFTAFNVGVVYPYIWDTAAKVLSGDPQAQERRAGAATIPYTIWHMVLGDEKVTKLISEAFALPPITKAIVEGASNRQLFTGSHIWEPEDNGLGKMNDVGLWMAGNVVAPVRDVADMASGKRSPKDVLSQQFGIKPRMDEKKAMASKLQQRDKTTAKRRQAKRGYFKDEE